MKFHKIVIENLNSLAGRHEIDLESTLGEAGLFLIHGPTGAGKSTILDAICLALYGKTPRFDDKTRQKVVEIDGLSPNDPALVMTRGAWSCLAEVELSMTSIEGRLVRYRATWAVQRAHKKATGKFQEPRRALQVLDEPSSWRDLVGGTKKAEIEETFGRALQGLSFEDFQRTTLLAQFAFRQFLEADEKQRGELLARMTDGGRFKEIGRRAGTAHKEAKEKLERIGDELGAKVVLSEAEEGERRALLATKGAEASTLDETLAALGRKREAWNAWRSARDRLGEAEKDERAVHEERAARAADLDALGVDRRLSPARQALDELGQRLTSAEEARDEAAKAGRVRDELAHRHDAVAERRAATARAYREAAERYQVRRAELAAADDAWAAWKKAQELSASRDKEAREREQAWLHAVAETEARRGAETKAIERLAEVDAQLSHIPQRERLLAEIVSLEASREAQKKQGADLESKTSALEEKREASRQLMDTLARASETQTSLEEDWGRARARVDAAVSALAMLLGDMSPEQAARLYAERKAALVSLIERLDRLEASRAGVVRLVNAVQEVEVEVERVRAEVADAQVRVERQEDEERQLEERIETKRLEVELRGQVMHLVEQRSVLTAGEPCPLCGSVDHPYADAPETAPDSAQARANHEQAQRSLAELMAARAQVKRALEAARRMWLEVGQRSSGLVERAGSLGGELSSARKRVADEEHALGLGDDAPAPGREAARVELEGLEAKEGRLAVLAGEVRAAKEAEEEARARRDRGASERQRLEVDISKSKTSIEADEASIAQLEGAIETAASELRERLVALEIREPLLLTAVAEARRRADRVKELTQEREAASVGLSTATQRRAQAEATGDGAQREWTRARDERAVAEALVVSTRAALHFEGRDPATVRAELENAERAARAEDDLQAKALSDVGQELAAAEAIVRAKAEIASRAQQALSQAELAFEERRLQCGAASAEDVRARSLDGARRAELSALEERLAHRQTAAVAKLEAGRAAFAEAEARLAREAEAGEAATRLEAIEAERAAVSQALGNLQQEVGALQAELARNDAERAAVSVLRARLDEARHDYDHWLMVYELIGEKDGKAFEDLVQALNLHAVIERANARLAGFMQRYALVQAKGPDGVRRLDFLVLDRYQDDAIRGTKSLSGGESFIVSLALALGLADLRSSRLRIETLLIDEGFGSLDMRTLQDVLAALGALQASSGAQIGLISHVDAMKEVIPAQIEVVPLGDGRSKVEVRA